MASTSRAAVLSPVQLILLGPSRYLTSNPSPSYNSIIRGVAWFDITTGPRCAAKNFAVRTWSYHENPPALYVVNSTSYGGSAYTKSPGSNGSACTSTLLNSHCRNTAA